MASLVGLTTPRAPGSRPPARGIPWTAVGAGLVAAAAAFAALVVALVLAGGAPVAPPPGLPDAGTATVWGVRMGRLVLDVTALLTVGYLLVAAALVPGDEAGDVDPRARGALRAASATGGAWALAAGSSFVLVTSESTGSPPAGLSVQALRTVAGTASGRAVLVVVAVAVLASLCSLSVHTVRGARVVLCLAVGGLLPVPLAGHAVSAGEQDVVVSGLAVHVVAVAIWIGGLVALTSCFCTTPRLLAGAARRFSVVALCCYAAVATSGLLVATSRLGVSAESWASGYGAVVAGKATVLVLLGVVGATHRRRTLPQLDDGSPRAFLRLAGAELVLMGSAAGLAAALSSTPAPGGRQPGSSTHAVTHPALGPVTGPLSWEHLLTDWRVNAVVLVVVALAWASYSAGERVLRRAGQAWPLRRGLAFRGGLVLTLVTCCSGAARYAHAMVSVQIAQLLVALLAVPLLLGLGAPFRLWLCTRQQRLGGRFGEGVLTRRWVATASDTWVGAVLACVLLLVLYRSPLVEAALESVWVQLLVLAAALLAGCVLVWPLLVVDPVARLRTPQERAAGLAAVAGCLGMLALQLGYGDRLLAAGWFLELRLGWVDAVEDQRAGALVMGVVAVLVLSVAAFELWLAAPSHLRTWRPEQVRSEADPVE